MTLFPLPVSYYLAWNNINKPFFTLFKKRLWQNITLELVCVFASFSRSFLFHHNDTRGYRVFLCFSSASYQTYFWNFVFCFVNFFIFFKTFLWFWSRMLHIYWSLFYSDRRKTDYKTASELYFMEIVTSLAFKIDKKAFVELFVFVPVYSI